MKEGANLNIDFGLCNNLRKKNLNSRFSVSLISGIAIETVNIDLFFSKSEQF